MGRQVDQVDSIHRSHTLWCPACFGLWIYIYICIYIYLVGGLEHFLFTHILGIIIPTDFHIFQRGWNHQPDINRSIGFTLYPTKELWLLARWAHQQVFQQNIFDHLGWLKPYKQWDKPFINWCRISSIHSTFCFTLEKDLKGSRNLMSWLDGVASFNQRWKKDSFPGCCLLIQFEEVLMEPGKFEFCFD